MKNIQREILGHNYWMKIDSNVKDYNKEKELWRSICEFHEAILHAEENDKNNFHNHVLMAITHADIASRI